MHGVQERYARPEGTSRSSPSRPDEDDDKPNQWPPRAPKAEWRERGSDYYEREERAKPAALDSP